MHLSVIIISLLLLPLVRAADVDCWTACRSCRDQKHHAAMLDIYCAMCQECKDRRDERLYVKMKLAGSMEENEWPTYDEYATETVTEPNYEGCPTAPPCSDEEDDGGTKTGNEPTKATTTTTRTPTTCPPIVPCKKKTKTTAPSAINMPSFILPFPPAALCPPPPMACVPPPYLFPPNLLFPTNSSLPAFQFPGQPPPPFNYPFPVSPYPFPHFIQPPVVEQQATPSSPSSESEFPIIAASPSNDKNADYMYMFLGVPKDSLKKKD